MIKASDLLYFLIQLEDSYGDPTVNVSVDERVTKGEILFDESDNTIIIGADGD